MNSYHPARPLPSIMTLLAITACCSFAQVYDPAAGFSDALNPSGVWSYGYSLNLGGPLILHAACDGWEGFPTWRTDIGSGDPLVSYNPTSMAITYGSLTIQPGQLILHPGPNNEIAVLRFTAPTSGTYWASGSFCGCDSTTTDVHVLTNGVSAFDGVVNGYGESSSTPFEVAVALSAGGHIDFAVGWGDNGGYNFDSTGLRATVATPPPELRLTEPSVLSDGRFAFTLQAHPGRNYRIVVSSNLRDWGMVTSFRCISTPVFLICPSSGFERQFYRAEVLP